MACNQAGVSFFDKLHQNAFVDPVLTLPETPPTSPGRPFSMHDISSSTSSDNSTRRGSVAQGRPVILRTGSKSSADRIPVASETRPQRSNTFRRLNAQIQPMLTSGSVDVKGLIKLSRSHSEKVKSLLHSRYYSQNEDGDKLRMLQKRWRRSSLERDEMGKIRPAHRLDVSRDATVETAATPAYAVCLDVSRSGQTNTVPTVESKLTCESDQSRLNRRCLAALQPVLVGDTVDLKKLRRISGQLSRTLSLRAQNEENAKAEITRKKRRRSSLERDENGKIKAAHCVVSRDAESEKATAAVPDAALMGTVPVCLDRAASSTAEEVSTTEIASKSRRSQSMRRASTLLQPMLTSDSVDFKRLSRLSRSQRAPRPSTQSVETGSMEDEAARKSRKRRRRSSLERDESGKIRAIHGIDSKAAVADMKCEVSVPEVKSEVPVPEVKTEVPVPEMKTEAPVPEVKTEVPVPEAKAEERSRRQLALLPRLLNKFRTKRAAVRDTKNKAEEKKRVDSSKTRDEIQTALPKQDKKRGRPGNTGRLPGERPWL